MGTPLGNASTANGAPQRTQTPIAVIGMSCRLPGGCNSPEKFWQFLLDGGVAETTPPSSRFSFAGHYDGTLRPWTMRSPGGMFIDMDPRDIDAAFFGLSHVDAVSMDPQQRQLLEVVYEGLENSGLTLEGIKSKLFGCFVGSYASDYSDIQARDPEDKSPSPTVGCGRAMLSNRISHFLDIKGPSMTIDTACSGSLIAVDLACRYLDSGDAEGAIVAGCNLYMSPEHNMDQHAMTAAASPTGRCWTFDARADGYIKAEAINCLVLKRLDDAIRDGDPIRAVIRGTCTNSDGWTAGISSPSAAAQALAIQRAYQRAGISRLSDTPYLECHGTGTVAGDPVECAAAASVLASKSSDTLRIGSVKSNIGHSEPAAGISGMIKSVLAVERGMIPGNPTFDIPNPTIDFEGSRLAVSNKALLWPVGRLQRASVNSFGYGGSNAHAVLEHPSILLGREYTELSVTSSSTTDQVKFGNLDDYTTNHTRQVLVFSANDGASLAANIKEHIRHLSNPAVKVNLQDLAYTLGRRRTQHFHRAYVVSDSPRFKESQVVHGKVQAASGTASSTQIGYVFTGQGAQWPQMGRELLSTFPEARKTVRYLEQVLKALPNVDAPSWSLEEELCAGRSAEHIRQPAFSQPLVTALQLALLAVLRDWGISPTMVIGHSSGEIAAAVAAGFLSAEDGIKVAYLRGKATQDVKARLPADQEMKLGMLAVGLSPSKVQQYIQPFPLVQIACYNSPQSVTISGPVNCLENIHKAVKADNGFARLLLVDSAYHHSIYMKEIGQQYRKLLLAHCPNLDNPKHHPAGSRPEFFSSVDESTRISDRDALGIDYWVNNLLFPVRFSQAISTMMNRQADSRANTFMLLELGPSGALAGPINQVRQSISQEGFSVQYHSPINRSSPVSTVPLYDLAGKFYLLGTPGVDWFKVNMNSYGNQGGSQRQPRIITDLPNYQWNHSIKYWHESLASHDWRYRPFPVHDLLGSKVLGTSWEIPTWKRTIRLKDVPWIRDHTIGTNVVFPASGYIAMAVEAMFQVAKCSGTLLEHVEHEFSASITRSSQLSYQLRDVRLLRVLLLQEDKSHQIYLSLTPAHGRKKNTWFHFQISSIDDNANKSWAKHCTGLVRLHPLTSSPPANQSSIPPPLEHTVTPKLWYKSLQSVGFNFGPTFQTISEIDCVAGQRKARVRIDCPASPPLASGTRGASQYPIHPCVFDGFFQACTPAMYQGHRTLISRTLVPKIINEITIYSTATATPSSSITNGSGATTNQPNNNANGNHGQLNLLVEAASVFSVPGRRDKVLNYASNATVFDLDKPGTLVAEISGLHYNELPLPAAEIGPLVLQHAPPVVMTVISRPDISLLDPDVDLRRLVFDSLRQDSSLSMEVSSLSAVLDVSLEAGYLISLLKHKVATPSVLDMDISNTPEAAVITVADSSESTAKSGDENPSQDLQDIWGDFQRYVFTFSDPGRLSSMSPRYLQAKPTPDGEEHESSNKSGDVNFHLFDPRMRQVDSQDTTSTTHRIFGSDKFDLVILRMDASGLASPANTGNDSIKDELSVALQTAREVCADHGFVLVLLQVHSEQHASCSLSQTVNGSPNGSSTPLSNKRLNDQGPADLLNKHLTFAGLDTRATLVSSSSGTILNLAAPMSSQQPKSSHADAGDLVQQPEGVETRVLDLSALTSSSTSTAGLTKSRLHELHRLDTTGQLLQDLPEAADFFSTQSISPYSSETSTQPTNPSKVLILLDDPSKPLLPDGYKHPGQGHQAGWNNLKALLLSSSKSRGHHIIWVLFGSDSTNPTNGLVKGFTRSIRNENPDSSLTLFTLNPGLNVNPYQTSPDNSQTSTVNSAGSIMRLVTLLTQVHTSTAQSSSPSLDRCQVLETEYTEQLISHSPSKDGQTSRLLCIDRIKPVHHLQTPTKNTGITSSWSGPSSETGPGSPPELQETPFHQNPNIIRLHCERVGLGTGMNSLYFNEIPPPKPKQQQQQQHHMPDSDSDPDDLEPGQVEVSIRAAGLNYKDIATTLGLVPENEHLLGLEGAGIITRIRQPLPHHQNHMHPTGDPEDMESQYKVGDRVAVFSRGCFANRVIAPIQNIFLLPDNISLEEAATLCIVYFTAIYSLVEIARLPELLQQRRRQKQSNGGASGLPLSIVIHSAAGGVGQAAIQICRHLSIQQDQEIEIYATVGNDTKGKFLTSKYGIPETHIFSSRNTQFAQAIRSIRPGGGGIDVVLNSLTGELQDESWRLLAEGGIFLEIGKRDIIEGNVLDMGPFDRGCSYHGVDISRSKVWDDGGLFRRCLGMIRSLLEGGGIEPIRPIRVFGFGEIADAMRYMRSGEHIGKIVISHGDGEESDDVRVLARPLLRDLDDKELALDSGSAYLLVGGLRGLCGSLAVYLAPCGAKHIVVVSRSGGHDEVSRRVVRDLENLGVEVSIFTADVTNLAEIKGVFRQSRARRPIKGIIHGAMVLRDKTFEAMTEKDFQEALAPKYAGTWNLHVAAGETDTNLNGRLDFFTMLSSISGVVGTAGQANYAAGNSFQDAFSGYRCSLGLAAQAVDLGAVDDVGYLSENQAVSDRLRSRSHITSLAESQLHHIVRMSILMQLNNNNNNNNNTTKREASTTTTQLVTGVSFPIEDNSPLLSDKRFHTLLVPNHQRQQQQLHSQDPINSGNSSREGHMTTLLQAMIRDAKLLLPKQQALTLTKREGLVKEATKLVNGQLVRILGLSTDMEGYKPLRSYGIDSLAAVDLRNWLKLQLGVDLSTFDILNGGTLDEIGGKIVDLLLKD